MKQFLLMAIAAAALGCAATGVRVSDEALARLQPRVTTVDQAVGVLGSPTTRMKMADGTTSLHYVYAEVKIRPASFVPIVGALAGGSDVRTRSVTLRFDVGGQLVDMSTSQSEYGTGTGAAAGATTPGPVQQPR